MLRHLLMVPVQVAPRNAATMARTTTPILGLPTVSITLRRPTTKHQPQLQAAPAMGTRPRLRPTRRTTTLDTIPLSCLQCRTCLSAASERKIDHASLGAPIASRDCNICFRPICFLPDTMSPLAAQLITISLNGCKHTRRCELR